MITSRTRPGGNRARRAQRRHFRAEGPRGHRLAWLGGAALVCLGALTGAFGTVAWLTALCATSFPQMLVGIVGLGVAPVVGGGALLWAGLHVLESEAAKDRVRALGDARFVEAARGGATSATVAMRLGILDVLEVERRLDRLVAHDALLLEVTEQGEALYRPPFEPSTWGAGPERD